MDYNAQADSANFVAKFVENEDILIMDFPNKTLDINIVEHV